MGYVLITEPGKRDIESDTFTCVHCNRICHIHIGSGVERGFCFNCNGPHCGEKRGTKNCWECVPFEAILEMKEGTRDRWHRVDLRKGSLLNPEIPMLGGRRGSGLFI